MRRASLNHAYRVVWNEHTGSYVAVAEVARARGKSNCRSGLAVLAVSLGVSASAWAGDLPVNGQITAGSGSISQTGNTLQIQQGSDKLAINWQSFSIGQGNTVNFVQPSASAVALNRVTGSEVSVIQGALNANGQVFLINPNGVLFTPTSQVNVGGLVATTLNQSDADFLAGRNRFAGSSTASVVNQGSITAHDGGYLALIAAKVENVGTLVADKGAVALAAGSDVTLDLGLPAKIRIDSGALDSLVANGGAIRADGGTVMLSAKAADELLGSSINNTGVIQAHTLASGEDGKILLLGDMQHGTLDVGGSLDASAPVSGKGGFIETSAAQVNTAQGLQVTAGSANGAGGTWLIDPYDYVINSTAAGNIVSALNTGTSVTVSTATSNSSYGGQGTTNGDITVSSAISKSSGGDATLTLHADRNIIVNSNISSSAGKLNLTLSADNALGTYGGVNINANLSTNGGNLLVGGAAGSAQNGIGYAVNLDSSSPAVVVQQNRSISTSGGDIVINGQSALSASGSYSSTKGGIYVKSGASLNSGGGNLFLSGVSTSDSKVFGFGVEGNSGTVTTFTTSGSTGAIVVDAQNTLNADGALGLVNNGNQARVQFSAPSVAHMLFKINGSSKLSTFTISPPCGAAYPNCGTLLVPGANSSYLYASYQAVNMATNAMYVFTGNGSKTYDASTSASGLTVTTLGAPGGFSTGSLAFHTSSKNAGTYTSLINDAANPDTYTSGATSYAVAYFYGSYTISPKTITPTAASKVYDGTTAASVTSSGVLGGDSVTFNYTSGTFASKDVGTGLGVTVSGITLAGADAANYAVSSSTLNTTANITARVLNLSGTRVYDGASTINAGILGLGNLVSGEDLVLSGTGSVADKNAASSKSLTLGTLALANGSAGAASNYTLAGGTHTADITKAGLTVSGLAAQNKVYDGNATATLSGTAALAGVIGSDSVSVSGGAMSGVFADKNVGSAKSVSASLSGISLTGTDAGNYQVTGFASPLSADIAKATLTVSGLAAQNKTYDGNTAATLSGTGALAGVMGADTVVLSGSTPTAGTFADKDVGTGKAVSTSLSGLSLSGTDAGNYQLGGLTSALTADITKATLTVSGLAAQNKTYDGNTTATLSGTAGLAGLFGSDVVTLSGSAPTGGTFADKNAGTGKAVSASLSSLSLSGTDAGNYQLGGLTSALSADITKAGLTVSGLSAQNKVYDGNTDASLAGTAALSGVIGSDSVSVNGAAAMTGSFSDKNAGTAKSVSASLSGISLTGTDAGNYQVTGFAVPLSADITKATVTVSGLAAQNKTYDGNTTATLSGTAGLAGLIGSDVVALSGVAPTGGTFADKNVGTGKAVTASLSGLSLSGTDAGNYQLGGMTSALSADITKATVTVSGLSAQNKTYDGNTAATLNGTAGLAGLIGSDVVTLSGSAPTGGTFADKNAGTGKAVTASLSGLSLSGTDAGNYQLGGMTSALSADITKATLTVSGLAAQNKTYDGNTTATLSGAAGLTGLIGSDVVALSGSAPTGGTFADKNAGTGKAVTASLSGLSLSGTDAGNYQLGGLSSALSADITKATLTVSGLAAQNKTYDGNTAATLSGTAGLAGLIGSDVVALSGSAPTGGTFVDKNAGSAKSVSVVLSAMGLTGADAGNYQLGGMASALTADITKAALTVSGLSAQNKVYDGNSIATISGTPKLNGIVGPDNVGLDGGLGGATFGSPAAGAAKPVSVDLTGLQLNGADAGNYEISGLAAPLTAGITEATPTAEPAQFLPKTVQVEQFLGNAANLPVSMPAPGAPDSLNYVAVAGPSANGQGLGTATVVAGSAGNQGSGNAAGSDAAVNPVSAQASGQSADGGSGNSESSQTQEGANSQSTSSGSGGKGVNVARNGDGIKSTNVYVVTTGINLGR